MLEKEFDHVQREVIWWALRKDKMNREGIADLEKEFDHVQIEVISWALRRKYDMNREVFAIMEIVQNY